MNDGELPEWARGVGSIAGAIVAVIFAQPKSRMEAAGRLIVSDFVGYIFGIYAIPHLQVIGIKPDANGTLAASFVVAFMAWLLLGYAVKLLSMRAEAQLHK
jgi:hypothetical protein